MTRRLFFVVLAAVTTLALVGCAGERAGPDEAGAAESTPQADPPFGAARSATDARVVTEAERDGLRAMSEGRLDEAAEAFRRAVEQAPDDAEPRFLLGACVARAGRIEAGLELFAEALSLDPTHLGARVTRARVLAWTERDDAAIEDFLVAIEQAPDASDLRVETAAAMIRAGRPDDAVRLLDDVVVREPMRVEVRLARAWALVAARRWSEAKAALEQDLTEFPQDPRFALMISRLLAAAPDAAVRDTGTAVRMGEAIARNLPSTESAEVLAMAYAQAGRFDEAVAVLDSARVAVERSGSAALAARFDRLTADFGAGRPCREPFSADAPGLRPPPAPPFPTSPSEP